MIGGSGTRHRTRCCGREPAVNCDLAVVAAGVPDRDRFLDWKHRQPEHLRRGSVACRHAFHQVDDSRLGHLRGSCIGRCADKECSRDRRGVASHQRPDHPCALPVVDFPHAWLDRSQLLRHPRPDRDDRDPTELAPSGHRLPVMGHRASGRSGSPTGAGTSSSSGSPAGITRSMTNRRLHSSCTSTHRSQSDGHRGDRRPGPRRQSREAR